MTPPAPPTPSASRISLLVESPQGQTTLHIAPDAPSRRLTDILRRANLPLNTRCGQKGLCDACQIELLRGKLVHIATGAVIDTDSMLRGCEHALPAESTSPVHIRIPARSMLAYEPLVVTEFSINVPHAHNPLYAAAPGEHAYGIAIDIGTTTVAVLLVELATGRILAESSAFNQQMHLGDDVVTRISLCFSDPKMLPQLQHAIARATIAPLIQQVVEDAHIKPDHIKAFAVAGNTTMLHLLAGVDPSSMGVAPFTPKFVEHRIIAASDLFNVPGAVHLLPSASAYIGADLTAGIVASGLIYDDGPSLLVDVGTNGEIILKHQGQLLGCATAAGPAFEGAGLTSGIRAGDGAISAIKLRRDPFSIEIETIGQEKHIHPAGLCGSAYIDFLAQARAAQLIGHTGRFDRAALPPDRAVTLRNGDIAFKVATEHGRHILISQADIARLLQAKAAIAAGILILLKTAGLHPSDVKRLYLAGGFGTHMSAANAISCGLLPGFRQDQIVPVGNTSLAGAYLALMDAGILDELSRIGQRLRVIELNLDPDFEPTYIDQLALP